MKKLLFIFAATVMTTVASSQTFTIKATECDVFGRFEKTSSEAVITSPEHSETARQCNVVYVLDLTNKTVFYNNSNNGVSNSIKIDDITKTGNDVRITFTDNGVIDESNKYECEIIFNEDLQIVTFSYFNPDEITTWVFNFTKFNIKTKFEIK